MSDSCFKARGNWNSDRVVTALAVSADEEDRRALRSIFEHSRWSLAESVCLSRAARAIRQKTFPVIICDDKLPDGSWLDLDTECRRLAEPPRLIVASRIADDHLWAEVLNLGGYDVLAKPFDREEIFRIVGMAWLNWKQAYRAPRKGAVPSAARGSLPLSLSAAG